MTRNIHILYIHLTYTIQIHTYTQPVKDSPIPATDGGGGDDEGNTPAESRQNAISPHPHNEIVDGSGDCGVLDQWVELGPAYVQYSMCVYIMFLCVIRLIISPQC